MVGVDVQAVEGDEVVLLHEKESEGIGGEVIEENEALDF